MKIVCSCIDFHQIVVSGLSHWELATCLESCVLWNNLGVRCCWGLVLGQKYKRDMIIAHIGDTFHARDAIIRIEDVEENVVEIFGEFKFAIRGPK